MLFMEQTLFISSEKGLFDKFLCVLCVLIIFSLIAIILYTLYSSYCHHVEVITVTIIVSAKIRVTLCHNNLLQGYFI